MCLQVSQQVTAATQKLQEQNSALQHGLNQAEEQAASNKQLQQAQAQAQVGLHA